MTLTLETQTIERRLATIETITEIAPIPDAKEIVRARIRGWDVVVRKADFVVGDSVVYIEVDSFLNLEDPRFAFLAARSVRTSEEGVDGHVLKTARLRGQYSQGLAIALRDFPELAGLSIGADVTEALGIVKWDPPIPVELAGSVVGFLPSSIRTTGENRVQNFAGILNSEVRDGWVATEKVDGTSMSVWVNDDARGVAGRNYEFEFNADNAFWATALKLRLHELLNESFPNAFAVIQGELYGAGLPSNPLNMPDKRFSAFTLQVEGSELPRSMWPEWALEIAVPVYDLPYPTSVDEALAQVDGIKSLISPTRNAEGVVWRNISHVTVMVGDRPERASWKCISNKYAMKHDA
jgi:RNA ligase (TIGR02306 family)